MIVLGLLGVGFHHRSVGWRISGAYLLIIVVGIGSVLFHATLQFEHQMWDEVPMVWTACYLLWILLKEHGYERHLYGICIACYCGLATYVTSQSKGTTQFYMFQTSFGVVMWSCFWFVWKSYRQVQKSEVRRLFHTGTYYLIAAIGVWLFDSNLCFIYDYGVPNFQLHAWWHVLMSISLHYFFVACGHETKQARSECRRIGYFMNIIPYVESVEAKKS
ncbi:ceramidase [Radiomyces spectabilis]|uniref:ceramidase n=1 Tax=Radiomyces spectabilis TaxID=64574 RepID=UPI002220D5CE|nr:ceramidase [Radiomyces spectabilis]KAI8393789.1 ceramidase [Radiomyces spectabilis]